MGEYIDGQNILSRRPEPGRHFGLSSPPKKEEKINVDSIANAVIMALEKKMGSGGLQSLQAHKTEADTYDTYDTSASLNELAKAMIVSKDVNSGNLNDVGTVKETKKDDKETKKTIDLLSKLGD